MRNIALGFALAALAFAAPAGAADGDFCSAAQWAKASANSSPVDDYGCYVLCDDDTANGNCSEFDLGTHGGIPTSITFLLYENGTCTAGTATIRTSGDQGLTTASNNTYDIGATTSLAIGGVTKIVLDTAASPVERYISVALTSMTCSGGLDVLAITHRVK